MTKIVLSTILCIVGIIMITVGTKATQIDMNVIVSGCLLFWLGMVGLKKC